MKNLVRILLFIFTLSAFAQKKASVANEAEISHKYRVSTPVITLPQLFMDAWGDRKHTQHIEIHIKRKLDDKNIIGLKLATWRLFQPMGIQYWNDLFDKLETGSEFYPGHVRESGIGITYQRMLWKGLFATVEVLPQYQTYLDENGNKISNDFKLYNSYHLGYYIAFGKKKHFYIEPQIHINQWMFDDNAPEGFKELDEKWKNYFLFEPNIYLGVNF